MEILEVKWPCVRIPGQVRPIDLKKALAEERVVVATPPKTRPKFPEGPNMWALEQVATIYGLESVEDINPDVIATLRNVEEIIHQINPDQNLSNPEVIAVVLLFEAKMAEVLSAYKQLEKHLESHESLGRAIMAIQTNRNPSEEKPDEDNPR